MNKPLISVIMSVYNDEIYLSDCIESILNQTYKNFEFIICNDCSHDNSAYIINKYKKIDSRIIFIENDINMGLAASLNRCISIANGEFLARMDSDDISLPTRFEREIEFLLSNKEYDVVACKCNIIDESNKIYKQMLIHNGEVTLLDGVKKVQIAHPTVLMRTNSVKEVGGYTVNKLTTRAEDYDLWCKLLISNHRLYGLNEILFNYREGLNGLKKRKYKFRIQEAKIKFYWMKKTHSPFYIYIYAIKPLIVGLLPTSIIKQIKKMN